MVYSRTTLFGLNKWHEIITEKIVHCSEIIKVIHFMLQKCKIEARKIYSQVKFCDPRKRIIINYYKLNNKAQGLNYELNDKNTNV